MAPFDLDGFSDDRAFHLAKIGPVHLLRETGDLLDWLSGRGYRVVRLAAGTWATQADFHREAKEALDFPDYYGHNLDAFNDAMRDVGTYSYGASRTDTGTVLVFDRFDAFARREPRAAQVIADILAQQARFAMLFGHRVLCLLQSDDPDLSLAPVGATPVTWYRS